MSESIDPLDQWLTVSALAQEERAFTEPSLRYLVFSAQERHTSTGVVPGNGLAPAIRRVGRKVLINRRRFRDWIEGKSA